jgi:glycosyltransferase involved in cell wall biosynthesis
MAIKVLELELSEQIRPIWGVEGYNNFYILVRYQGRPVGWTYITVQQPVVSADRLREAITEQLGWELLPHVLGELIVPRAAGSRPLPPISVVVCTRDRAEQLKCCLRALMALDYPDYEIIVVDNASRSDATSRLVARLPVCYVREERPGLDWARNRGIAEARHDIIAFTDDDARPDRGWLRAIARAFEELEVMAVTGLVVPTELETRAQILFEFDYGGIGHGFHRRVIRREGLSDRKLLWASAFGVGANMAFRRELFDAIGPFDVALDVGTPSGGGGDVEMFHRLVAQGCTLVYEPAALVWHTHWRDMASLCRCVYNNGRSFGAYLLTCGRNRTVSRFSILRLAVRQWVDRRLLRRLRRPGKFPRHLVAIELAGALLSPLAYRAAQRRARQITIKSHAQAAVGLMSYSQRSATTRTQPLDET